MQRTSVMCVRNHRMERRVSSKSNALYCMTNSRISSAHSVTKIECPRFDEAANHPRWDVPRTPPALLELTELRCVSRFVAGTDPIP